MSNKLHITIIAGFAAFFLWWGFYDAGPGHFEFVGVADRMDGLAHYESLNLHARRAHADPQAGPLQPVVSWLVLGTYQVFSKPMFIITRPELLKYEYPVVLATTLLAFLLFLWAYHVLLRAFSFPNDLIAGVFFALAPLLLLNMGMTLAGIVSLAYWGLVLTAYGENNRLLRSVFPTWILQRPGAVAFFFAFVGSWINIGMGLAFFIGHALLTSGDRTRRPSSKAWEPVLWGAVGTVAGVLLLAGWAYGGPWTLSCSPDRTVTTHLFSVQVYKVGVKVFRLFIFASILNLIVATFFSRSRRQDLMIRPWTSFSFLVGMGIYLLARLPFADAEQRWLPLFMPALYLGVFFAVAAAARLVSFALKRMPPRIRAAAQAAP